MALPDGLRDDELAQHGFKTVSGTKAKHRQHNSYLNKCEGCSLWFKQLESREGKMLCRGCRRAARSK